MRVLVLSLFVAAFAIVGKTQGSNRGVDINIATKGCVMIMGFSRSDVKSRVDIHYSIIGTNVNETSVMAMEVGEGSKTAVYTFRANHDDALPKHCGVIRRDPHIMTFDGRRYTYNGLCWHTLVVDCTDEAPRFEVLGKFEPRDPIDREVRTRTTDVTVIIGGQVIEMDASNNVKVNGRTAPETVELVEEDMTLAVDNTRGGYTFININDIITFTWNGGEHAFNAAFDGDNQVRLCGLLGNADGDATNDLIMRNGRITKDVVEFGNSWRVDKLRCD